MFGAEEEEVVMATSHCIIGSTRDTDEEDRLEEE
jgi:hypothetical protein